jgi:CHAT domain-containing protein
LWWCPTGPFTYLPIHAAAPLESQFIQSYTSTLDALIHAKSKLTYPDANDTLTGVGLVKVSNSLGSHLVMLPSVAKELSIITTLFGDQAHQLRDSQATIVNVVKDMQSSAWLHLSCHGSQNGDHPLKSGLHLYDGKLELGQILDINLPRAKFVFLSACETAMGDKALANEAMHLAGGFIAAGFQGAIGTLWSMVDADGPRVTDTVYQTILGDNKVPDVQMAAKGLHLAIQKLRKDKVPFHRWVPFIHMGI